MKSFILFGLIVVFGWNLWAIERDKKLFKMTENQSNISVKYFCKNQAGWHPDCN